jgi:putative ABC transport system permease protein
MMWLKQLFSRRRLYNELSQEIQEHLDEKVEELVASGMSRKEAAAVARREFGNVTLLEEDSHEVWRWPSIENLVLDVRFGARTLRRNPGFAAVAAVTLALGIGANTAIFSVIEAVFLRSLPYKNPSRLVVFTDAEEPQSGGILYKDFQACKSHSRSFESIAAYYRDTGFSRVTLTTSGEPESVQGAFVSADFFPTLSISPLLGRTFTSEEELREEHVVILSNGLWLRRFAGSPEALGKNLQIDGIESKIIGVMPATFQFPNKDQQFWAPISTNRYWRDPGLTTKIDPRNTRFFFGRWQAIGRLKDQVRLQQARTEIDTVFARIAQSDPDKNRGPVALVPLAVNLGANTRLALLVLLGAVVFVLLIACSNIANLVLARGASRNREMAVRTALGAGRIRLTQQLFTENALLALLAGCLGLILASLGVHALVAFGPPDIPRLDEARVDGRVLAFTLGVSLFAAIIFGLIPAWKISQSDPNESLKSGGRGASGSPVLRRTRNVLVVTEFALAVVLLTGAGLLVRSFLAVQAVELGFHPERLLTMRLTLPAGVPDTRRMAVHDQVLQRVAALPRVKAVGAISGLFELGETRNLGLRAIEGRSPEPPEHWTPLTWTSISGGYLQAMGTPLLRGRYFSEQDGADSPLVALVDEHMAQRYWPGEDPLGKRFKGQDSRGHNDDWLTVIGVVQDMRRNGLERQPVPHVFEWYKQSGSVPRDLVVRTAGDPRMVASTLRSMVRGLDQDAILSSVTTMEQQLSDQLSSRRFQTSLLGLFSVMALILASVGIYALMHYSVSQRTNEMGVRIALGAQRGDIMGLVIREGGQLAIAGIGIGVAAALALTRLMSILLFGVDVNDPVTFGGVAVLLVAIALFACYIPAQKAMRVDPMVALRYE